MIFEATRRSAVFYKPNEETLFLFTFGRTVGFVIVQWLYRPVEPWQTESRWHAYKAVRPLTADHDVTLQTAAAPQSNICTSDREAASGLWKISAPVDLAPGVHGAGVTRLYWLDLTLRLPVEAHWNPCWFCSAPCLKNSFIQLSSYKLEFLQLIARKLILVKSILVEVENEEWRWRKWLQLYRWREKLEKSWIPVSQYLKVEWRIPPSWMKPPVWRYLQYEDTSSMRIHSVWGYLQYKDTFSMRIPPV